MNPAEYADIRPTIRLAALERGATSADVLSFYDSLPAVALDDMIGSWRGSEVPSGHPFDGLLTAFGWHGKKFDSAEVVHPLVFDIPGGGQANVDPGLLPIGLLVRAPGFFRHPLLVRAGRLAPALLRTSKPKARLRTMEYRGVMTATMTYDNVPIHDAFRAVGQDCVIGAMDLRGLNQPYMFALRRQEPRS